MPSFMKKNSLYCCRRKGIKRWTNCKNETLPTKYIYAYYNQTMIFKTKLQYWMNYIEFFTILKCRVTDYQKRIREVLEELNSEIIFLDFS